MKLHEVCDLIVDCPHTTAKDEGNGYALIRTPNIGKGRLELNGVHRVSKQVYDSRNSRAIPQANDLILAREAPVGNVAKILEGQEVCLGQRTVLIRPDKSKVSPDFLTYYLLSPEQQYNLTSAANGATVSHLNMGNIRNLRIDLPPRLKQDKIASILSAYDDKIANCKAQIALLEEAAQRLYREWFVDLHFPGYKTIPIGENGLPDRWTYKKLREVCTYQRGVSYTTPELGSGNILINLKNIASYGGYNFGGEKLFNGKYKDAHIVETNDLIMGITDMTSERRCVGHVALIPEIKGLKIISPDLIKLTSSIPKIFLYAQLRYGGVSRLLSQSANGTNVAHLKPEIAMNTEIIVPPDELMMLFNSNISNYIDKINNLLIQLSHAEEAKQLLLPRLISGQIEINA